MVVSNVKMIGIYPKWQYQMLKWLGFLLNNRNVDKDANRKSFSQNSARIFMNCLTALACGHL